MLNQSKKLNFYSTIIIISKNSLWFLFFFLQGRAIELAINKPNLFNKLGYILLGYVFVKIMAMLCDILQKFILEYFKNIELKTQWNHNFPQRLYKEHEQDQSRLALLFLDYLPRIFEAKSYIYCNTVTILYAVILILIILVYFKFYVAIFSLLIVFCLTYMSKTIFLNQIDKYQHETNNSKLKILNWISQYLQAYREISKNWLHLDYSSWINSIYQPYFAAQQQQNLFYFYRDILSQLLVELPFLVNSVLVITGVYYHYITLAQLFIWIGFCQFMINAANAYFENRVKNKECKNLIEQSMDILCKFKYLNTYPTSRDLPVNFNNIISKIMLQDGSQNILSLKPGVYRLSGGNGAGKSTLLNTILGYERRYSCSESEHLINSININQIRVIERDAIIFESIQSFEKQILGPNDLYFKSNIYSKSNLYSKNWHEIIINSINQLLEQSLAQQWLSIFFSLEIEYAKRQEKSMSSGERIIISLIRFFVSWNKNVRLLIIDECDAFLDYDKKMLFNNTISYLSNKLAIFISSHDTRLKMI